jgi:drug/metabolite transporter (DMT)-like permease
MPPLWIVTTLIGSGLQTARNAMQRSLIGSLGAIGATQVRFLYGFPFALIFLVLADVVTGSTIPAPNPSFVGFAFAGALCQIAATALMLWAMQSRSFSVTIAYTKTEPVQVALFEALVLGDPLSLHASWAILVATLGVILMVLNPKEGLSASGLRSALAGLAAGGFFALSSVFFRGAIVALGGGPFLLRASTALTVSLGMQSIILLIYMTLFDRRALTGSITVWKSSLFAGLMGSAASQLWFIGFALTSAANVRTLGLVEMIYAQIATRGIFNEKTTRREWVGMALILIGVGALVALS